MITFFCYHNDYYPGTPPNWVPVPLSGIRIDFVYSGTTYVGYTDSTGHCSFNFSGAFSWTATSTNTRKYWNPVQTGSGNSISYQANVLFNKKYTIHQGTIYFNGTPVMQTTGHIGLSQPDDNYTMTYTINSLGDYSEARWETFGASPDSVSILISGYNGIDPKTFYEFLEDDGETHTHNYIIDSYAHIIGHVYHYSNPVEGVEITSNDGTGRKFYTNALGYYDFVTSVSGTYTLTYKAPNKVPRTISGLVASGVVHYMNAVPYRDVNVYDYSHLTGVVKNSVTLAPIPDANVTSTDSLQNPTTAKTNGQGVYTTNNKQGTWTFTYGRAGYISKTYTTTLELESTATKNILLVPQN
jgi:hypothetical protein